MSSPEAVRSMFGRIAGAYDRANDLLSLGIHRNWKARLIREARLTPGLRILDVATGTGDLAFRFASHRVQPSRVVGADFCAPMLDVARARQQRQAGGASIEFVEADALQLPFEGAAFDRVSCAFGVRNFADPQAGLLELWRVLAPGGQLLVLEFGDWSTQGGVLGPFRWAARKLMPGVGGALSGDSEAYRYLFETSSVFPAGKRFLPWLQTLPGATEIQALALTGGVAWLYLATRARE